jgi:hypothetical protein
LADKITKENAFGIGIFSIVYGMGFNHNYVFFGLLLFTESMPQQVKESKAWISNISKEKIPRPLSATIPLSKLFHHAGQFLGRTDLVSVWSGCHFYSDRIC